MNKPHFLSTAGMATDLNLADYWSATGLWGVLFNASKDHLFLATDQAAQRTARVFAEPVPQ